MESMVLNCVCLITRKVSKSVVLMLFFCILFSCQNSKKVKIKSEVFWDEIQVITKSQKISIYCCTDTAIAEKTIYRKISGEFIDSKYKLDRIEKENFVINKIDRDSLFQNVYKLITKPTFTDKLASDYVGNVLIKLRDRNTTLMCEYKSVGDWSTVSNEAKKIYNLLNSKVHLEQ